MSKKFLIVVLSVFFVSTAFSQSKIELTQNSSQNNFTKENFDKRDLTNKFLNQKSDSGKVEIKSSVSKKSAPLAMLLSFVLPGAGHLYIDRMDVGKFFVMGEAASWLGFAGLDIYGSALREDARTFASENSGLNKNGKSDDYFSNVGNFNSVYEYNNDKLLRGQYGQLYDVDSYYWNWNNTANKDSYEEQRKRSERVYNSRVIFGTTLIINRIVSGISALILTNKKNNSTTLNIQPELIQKNYGTGVDGLKLNIFKEFLSKGLTKDISKEIKKSKQYNYKLTIEYDGTDFLGWQRQSYSEETIQGHVEKKLEVLLQEKITLYAAGRTDAGVHAINQIANFRTTQKILSDKFLYKLNSQLPKAITVKKISKAAEKFHSRFSAKQREYIYKITLRRKSIDALYYCRIFTEPDFKVIDSLIKFFMGRKSFFPLTKKKDDKHNFICELNLLEYKYYKSKGELIFKLRADRFLHSMVRSIIGCLIDAGRGNITTEEVKKQFNRGEKIKTQYLPAHALFLNKIYY